MGTFNTSCRIQHIVDRQKTVDIPQLLVDTGSEYTWVPEKMLESLGVDREKKDLTFVMANGQYVTRSVGYAIVHVEGHVTVDEVVFAEEGDLLLLGARTLRGLNLTIDPLDMKLISDKPLLAVPMQGEGLKKHRMIEDPIVAEVRAVRDAYARQFNYDLKAIVRDLRERQQAEGRKVVSFETKRDIVR